MLPQANVRHNRNLFIAQLDDKTTSRGFFYHNPELQMAGLRKVILEKLVTSVLG
jgi:hypothetical protein